MSLADVRPSILQVSAYDQRGGAARVAWDLFQAYRSRGHASWLAVGRKYSDDPDVLPIGRGPVSRLLAGSGPPRSPYLGALRKAQRTAVRTLRDPRFLIDEWRGYEDFAYPASHKVLDLPPQPVDVLHCHNLHGGYFDLRALPSLAARVPTVLTLHDEWLLTGHCAGSLGCGRWETGCGACPDLSIYPAIRRDATAENWRRKRNVYGGSSVWVAAPSRWLLDRAERSMLAVGMVSGHVIPNAVDPGVFRPGDRASARRALGLPETSTILLAAGDRLRANPFRDVALLCTAVADLDKDTLLIVVGGESLDERHGRATVRFLPRQEPSRLADFYRAADVFVHAARADTLPLVVIEAMACGAPVVATAVGGIPELVTDGATGFLAMPGDAGSFRAALSRLLGDSELRREMGRRAADEAARRFTPERQVDEYLALYEAAMDGLAGARGRRDERLRS